MIAMTGTSVKNLHVLLGDSIDTRDSRHYHNQRKLFVGKCLAQSRKSLTGQMAHERVSDEKGRGDAMNRVAAQTRRSMDMTAWLKCTVSVGQFPQEYSVRGKLFDGTAFSLFAPVGDVTVEGEVTRGRWIDGWVRVATGSQKDDRILVALPQPALENGQIISVKIDDIRSAQ
jgi:hypothetical protein